MNDIEVKVQTEQITDAEMNTTVKQKASKKSQAKRKRKQVKHRTKSSTGSVPPRKQIAIRKQLTIGKTEAETAEIVGETVETVKREARAFWEEMASELLADPTTSRVQAVMRALAVYAGSQEAISALAKDENAKPSDKVKYMELALDANKEIIKYQSMEKPATEKQAEAMKDARRDDERPTREQLDTAIGLLNERIAILRQRGAEGIEDNKAGPGR